MWLWRFLTQLVWGKDRSATASSVDATNEPKQRGCDEDTREFSKNPTETHDANYWDDWWKNRLSKDASDVFPMFEGPLTKYQDNLYDLANRDDLLVDIMSKYGLKTVLCVGNGISQEPRALAAAGFEVTALDISRVALHVAKTFHNDLRDLSYFCSPNMHRPGGQVDFVVGNLLDTTVCPGPFDVIIERRTVQRFHEHERAKVLEALSGRLSKVGILVTQCLDDPFPPELGWSYHETGLFHASESWFREHSWTIWDGAPSSILAGQLAWLIRTGSLKSRPRGKGNG